MNDNTQAAEALRDLLDDDGENRAVRAFLMLYGCGNPTAEQMAEHMRRSGFNVVPDWVQRSPGHLTKGGTQLWLRMLFDLEKAATPQQAEPHVKDHEIREAVTALVVEANTFHHHGLLRERLARIVIALMGRAGWKSPAERFTAEPPAAADGLPELPEDPEGTVEVDCGPAPGGGREVMFEDGYSAAQMRAYAREALALAAKPAQEALTEEWRAKLWELIDAYRTGSGGWPISCRDRIKQHLAGIGIKKDGTT